MAKYSEVSSSTEVNASAPCSAEFGLKATFPDDKGQSYPAKGIPYRARTPQGVVEGTLDGNGEVIMSDVGIGSVTIEVLPDVDKEIAELREDIRKELDAVIRAERAEGKALQETYDALDTTDKVLVSTGAVLQGGWNIIKGIGSAIGAVSDGVEAVAKEAGEYIFDPLNAPETFREDVEAVKKQYDELKHATLEGLEIFQTLKSDPKTWQMLEDFASDYIDAQHHTELTEGGSEAVIGIILTVFTAGIAGAAVAGTRLGTLAAKIGTKATKLMKLIRDKKWFKRKEKLKANKKKTVTAVYKAKVKCFKPGEGLKKGFKKRHPEGMTKEGRTLDEEFNRQLKNQEEGINKMSPDDLIDGIDNYKGMRDPKKSKEVRDAYKDKIFKKRNKELKDMGISIEIRKKLAQEYSESAAKQVAVLHNPDGIAGGKDAFKTENLDKHIGDKGVNSSLGSQWAKEDRTKELRAQAVEAKANGDKKMKTKLKRCK